MTRIKVLLIIICTVAACWLTQGCSHQKKWRIGVSQCSDDDWRQKMNEEMLREALFLGDEVDIEIRSADDSNERQIADLKYFRDNGFDLIAVAPNEAEALTPAVKEIYEAGIPVIVFDRTIDGDSFTAFRGAANETLGAQAAALAYARKGTDARILELEGLRGSTPAQYRHEGFHQAADSLGLTVVATGEGRWNQEDAAAVTDSLLDIFPDINVVYAHNDRMAMGASEVLTRRGMRDRVTIIGIDAAPAIGIQAVKDGVIDATFVYPTEGQTLISTAIDILEGRPFERISLTPTPSAVDPSNADIMLMQDASLRRETDKIVALKGLIDTYWQKHSIQTALLYGTLIIVLLAGVVIFLLCRAYWANKRHRLEMENRNGELQRQRDELDALYHQLEEATGSKLTFFTNVSHDLRTPLTLIADPVEQLSKAENLTPKQSTLMQLANKNVKRLLRLVNQILDIRKYDNGQLTLDAVNIDLADALREWMAPFAETAARRHLRFDTQIAAGADYVTAIDADKIERVIFNLLSNAFKFTRPNGRVSVAMHREGDNIIIAVSDTGVGISPDELSQVFARFFHAGGQINPSGSGIGLALSKTFVTMHGGNIEVESTEGEGTVFTVTLPVKHLDAPVAPVGMADAAGHIDELAGIEEAEAEVHDDAPTLLIIDDNPDISVLVKSILCDEYTVIRASSGMQGIRMASKYIPDLIVCDIMMPGMDGYETCTRLKQEPVTSHIPVLLLTACAREEQQTDGYACGADGYMTKPFDSAMLKARCRSLVENRKRVMAAVGPGKTPDRPAAAPKDDIDDEFYARFIALVEERLADADLTVEDLASGLGLSRVQMYRKIKALTNYSPAEILRNRRLERAARLLKTSERTVSEVAYEVGFSAPGYFTKCYKEYFNESPSDTRNRTSNLN